MNRRHKAALCATLICVGLIVLLGGPTHTVAGIALLGIAFSWAVGSNYRPVHWLFIVVGLILLVPAVGDAYFWPQSKSDLVKLETSAVESDRVMINVDTSSMADETDNKVRNKDEQGLAKDADQLRKDVTCSPFLVQS